MNETTRNENEKKKNHNLKVDIIKIINQIPNIIMKKYKQTKKIHLNNNNNNHNKDV
jgi:hypothetical protein